MEQCRKIDSLTGKVRANLPAQIQADEKKSFDAIKILGRFCGVWHLIKCG